MINIITINYNDSINLLRTILSVRTNKKEFHRFYIVDGDSKDDSIDIIKSNLDIIDGFLSEQDAGIYDAMNKVSKFSFDDNDFLYWLNAGDELLLWDDNIPLLIRNYDSAFFAVITKVTPNDIGHIVVPKIYLPYSEKNFYPKSMYMHQGFMIKYSFFSNIYYDTAIGLQADNLLMSQTVILGAFYVSNLPVGTFYLDGVSNKKVLAIFISYLKVAQKMNYSMVKILYYKKSYILKTFVRIILPFQVFMFLRNWLKKHC